jgi:hypothetical protein
MKHVNSPRLVLAVTAIAAALAPLAAADAVYHTEHLALNTVGGASLRSGFVQNMKAEGPKVYARERFVLNGAAPNTTYTVTRNFFVFDPTCGGEPDLESPVGEIATNVAGNGSDDAVVRPEEIPGFLAGDHGVLWTVTNGSGAVRYRTACTTVSLD